MKYKKILITGGAGFIGSSIVQSLKRKNCKIYVIDNLSEQIHGLKPESNSFLFSKIKNHVEFLRVCITNKSKIKKIVLEVDAIIHLAAETGTGQSMYDISKYNEVNNSGTSNILDILANNKHNLKKFIVASSRAIYGEGKYLNSKNEVVFPEFRSYNNLVKRKYELYCSSGEALKPIPTCENSKINPSSFYGVCKLFQEKAVLSTCASLNISSVALRYQNVYGPGQSLNNPYTGILAIFTKLMLKNETVNIFEDGYESRDFIYIDDVVNATLLALDEDNKNPQIYNVGSGIKSSVIYIAKILKGLTSSKSELVISNDFRLGDIRHNYADLEKIKKNLNFEIKTEINTGLSNFVKWAIKQNNVNDNSSYYKSLDEMKAKNLLKGGE